MKYNASLPDDKVNIPKDNLLFLALKLLFSLAVLIAIFYVVLKFTLDTIVTHLPVSYEKKLTSLVSFDLNITDGRSSKYLDEITETLSKCASLPYEVKTFIISENTPNAFALPGGIMYITEGMLKKLKNQNELVAIMGHEMGHFKNRDHLKGFGNAMIVSVISLLLGEGYGGILNASLNISNAKFSQSAEFESDIFALDVMQCAYGNVTDATKLFARLDKGEDWRYFLASHPTFKDRIDRMNNHILEQNYNTTDEVIPLKKF